MTKLPNCAKALPIAQELVLGIYAASLVIGLGEKARAISAVEADIASLARCFGYTLMPIESDDAPKVRREGNVNVVEFS